MNIDLSVALAEALNTKGVTDLLSDLVAEKVATKVLASIEAKERDKLLGLGQLAEMYGVSASAMKRRVQRSVELRSIALQVGHRRKWRRSEVVRLLEERGRRS